jgi:hypothetical protein
LSFGTEPDWYFGAGGQKRLHDIPSPKCRQFLDKYVMSVSPYRLEQKVVSEKIAGIIFQITRAHDGTGN